MGRPKRNAAEAGIVGRAIAASDAKKARKEVAATAAGQRSRRATGDETVKLGPKRTSEIEMTTTNGESKRPSHASMKKSAASKKAPVSKTAKASKTSELSKEAHTKKGVGRPRKDSNLSVPIPKKQKGAKSEEEAEQDVGVDAFQEEDENDQISYWLMKAEPESRIEKGVDVKFSIDDLKNKEAPEAWDGVRNRAARNNMRAMMKGDLAFLYHSNCKIPGVAGIMEIVREHSVDESAFDENHPYHDPNSTRDKPQWDVVHVEFRKKFKDLVKLKDLQKFAKPGGVLENLQTLKQSRLSVSKVSKKEWEFILAQAEIEEEEEEDTTDVVAASAED